MHARQHASEDREHRWARGAAAYLVTRGRNGAPIEWSRLEQSDARKRALFHYLWSEWSEDAVVRLKNGDLLADECAYIVRVLLAAPHIEVKAGAMFACYNLGLVLPNIAVFRRAARSDSELLRDAAAYGLGLSSSAEDEHLLWGLFGENSSEIRLSAALSLRDMPRDIDERRYRMSLKHMRSDASLIVAERALHDTRLLPWTRELLKRKWGAIQAIGWAAWFSDLPVRFGFSADKEQ